MHVCTIFTITKSKFHAIPLCSCCITLQNNDILNYFWTYFSESIDKSFSIWNFSKQIIFLPFSCLVHKFTLQVKHYQIVLGILFHALVVVTTVHETRHQVIILAFFTNFFTTLFFALVFCLSILCLCFLWHHLKYVVFILNAYHVCQYNITLICLCDSH